MLLLWPLRLPERVEKKEKSTVQDPRPWCIHQEKVSFDRSTVAFLCSGQREKKKEKKKKEKEKERDSKQSSGPCFSSFSSLPSPQTLVE